MTSDNPLRRAWRAFARAVMPDPQVTTSRVRTGGRTPAGVYVTPDTALKDATVWACVQYLTKTTAHLPWRVMVDVPGGAERVKSNPVDWLLGSRPCPDLGSFNWRQTMLSRALLWGNAYAEIQRDNRGAAYALWPIHPQRVTVRRGADDLLEYEVWNSGGNSVLRADDMFHLRGFGEDAVGYSVIEYAAESIGWARATQIFGSTYFGQGANPSAVVETGGKPLSPEGMEQLRGAFNKLYSGPKGDKTVFLDNGYTYKQVSTNPNDAQFIETRQHQVEEVCRWFGVPPHKVMHLLRATFSNIEHQSIEVVVDSITPWVKAFEEEANYKLFGANRQNYYTKIDLRGLLRGDSASRSQFYKAMFELGLPLNRILALEDEKGIGAAGDVSFVSNNVQTIDNAIAATGAVAPAGKPPVDLTDPASIAASFQLN